MFSRVLLRRIHFNRISLHAIKIKNTLPTSVHSDRISPYISQCLINIHTSKHLYAQEVVQETMNVDYEYVQRATGNNNVLIVDVREPDEVKEHGKIPNSVNIPLGNVSSVLTMPENEFQKAYKRPKPSTNTEIVFYCMIGKRSGKAQQSATELGYKNAKNYVGSWNDWASKSK